MPNHHRRLKVIEFTLGGTAYDCQIRSWQMVNNTDDGEKVFTFCSDGSGEYREEVDPDYALQLTYDADWTSGGISDYLTENDGELVAFVLEHHPDVPAEHVTWSGNCYLKAPSVGGDARTTETQEITLQVEGKPVYTREQP